MTTATDFSPAGPATLTGNRAAWQRMGRSFDNDGKPLDSAGAIEQAGLAWNVQKEALIVAADGAPVPKHFGLIRQDTRAVLSVVGTEYKPLQNVEAFSFLDSLLMDGVMRYEAALTVKGGRCLALMARLPQIDTIAPGDDSYRYILLTNWHGGGAINFMPISQRLACANQIPGLLHAAKREVSLRHTGNLRDKLQTVRAYLSQFDKAFDRFADEARRLVTGHTEDQAKAFINELFPLPANPSERQRTAHERRIAEIRRAWRSPAQQAPAVRGTWWALVNAVTESVDHGRQARQARDLTTRYENRFLSTTTGDGADLKARAFELALNLAG
jgi:phage/plasmid-like protein (TIGR03299 family)